MAKIVRHLVQTTGHLVLDMNLRMERVPSVVNHVVHIAVWAVEASHIIVRLVQYDHSLVLLVRRLLLRVSVTQGPPAPTAAHVPLASPASTKLPLVLPRAQIARPERSRQQSARPLPRPVLDVLPVPARPLTARPSLLARATSGLQDQTAARAPPASPEPTRTRRVVSYAPHALLIPIRLLRAWP